MKLLHISSARTWRGGEQQIAYLIESLQQKNILQWVICVKQSAMEEYCQKQNIPHYSYAKVFSVNPVPALLIARIAKKHAIDLIHIHDSHSHTFSCMAASFFGCSIPMALSRRVDFRIQQNALSKWKYNHPSIKAILCVSHFIKTVLEKDLSNLDRIKVVHSGIDLEKFSFKQFGILRKEFNIDPSIKIIANVAAIAPHKDYFTFVDTAEILLKKELPLIFLMIGADGGEQEKIKTYIQQKGLTKKILFTGFRKDIPQILPEIDCLLFTSKTEGLGTSLLDTIACRIPIVATQAGGIPEIIIHQKTGLLAPVKDALALAKQVELLLANKVLQNTLSENALHHLQHFSKEKMAVKTLQIYQSLIHSS